MWTHGHLVKNAATRTAPGVPVTRATKHGKRVAPPLCCTPTVRPAKVTAGAATTMWSGKLNKTGTTRPIETNTSWTVAPTRAATTLVRILKSYQPVVGTTTCSTTKPPALNAMVHDVGRRRNRPNASCDGTRNTTVRICGQKPLSTRPTANSLGLPG